MDSKNKKDTNCKQDTNRKQEIQNIKERMASHPYVGYAMFSMAHKVTKVPQTKCIDQMETTVVRSVPPATTARSRQYSFVW